MNTLGSFSEWGSELFPDIRSHVIDESGSVIYVVDSDLCIQYCNSAWDRFAIENGGEQWLARQAAGVNVMDITVSGLQEFYRSAFQKAEGGVYEFDYQCSSATRLRLFRMQIFGSKISHSFAVVNSLRVDRPHPAGLPADTRLYASTKGIVSVCAHCRKARRRGVEQQWDWVPEFLIDRTITLSHGLCEVCRDYFYGDLLKLAR